MCFSVFHCTRGPPELTEFFVLTFEGGWRDTIFLIRGCVWYPPSSHREFAPSIIALRKEPRGKCHQTTAERLPFSCASVGSDRTKSNRIEFLLVLLKYRIRASWDTFRLWYTLPQVSQSFYLSVALSVPDFRKRPNCRSTPRPTQT